MTKDFVELRDLKAVLDEVAAADHAEYRVVPATEILCGQTVEKEGFDIEITKFVSDRVMQKTKDFWNAKIYAPKQPLRLKIRNICGDETIFLL